MKGGAKPKGAATSGRQSGKKNGLGGERGRAGQKKQEMSRNFNFKFLSFGLLECNELTLVCIYCLSLSFEEKDVIFALELNDTFQ